MNEQLETLSDAQLNEAFAVAFGGWKPAPLVRGDKSKGIVARFAHEAVKRPGVQVYHPTVLRFDDGACGGDLWPTYCTDANAVLPWLEKEQSFTIDRTHLAADGELYRVSLRKKPAGDALASTFARAAVIALLKAKRAENQP